jgi:hypothetical protein
MVHTRRTILLLAIALVSLTLTFSRGEQPVSGAYYTSTPSISGPQGMPPPPGTFQPPTATLSGTTTQISGRLAVVFGDPKPGSGLSAQVKSFIYDSAGKQYDVQLDPGVAIANINRIVTIQGNMVASTEPGSVGALSGASLTGPTGPRLITGPQVFVNLACKFSDDATEPKTVSYIAGTMANIYPRIDHFYRQTSFTLLNFGGAATVTHWYTLPSPRSTYITGTAPNLNADLTLLATDCTAAVDADVDFNNYTGTNMMFNGELNNSAWGGTRSLMLDGATRVFKTT